MRSFSLSIALLAVIPWQASAAQDTGEIVVEGARNRAKQIQAFVKALTPTPIGGQISRFDRMVCPAAVGLTEAQNRRVVERMREVARAAKIELGEAKCEPNAIVIVADDKDQFLRELRKSHPAYFATPLGESIPAPKEKGPATAWHIEGLLDANGAEAGIMTQSASRGPGYAGSGNGFIEESRKAYSVDSTDGTRIMPTSRPHFLAGILVVERSSLAGLTTTQLADYASMRIYGRTDPGRLANSAAPSILTILDRPMGSTIPITLTQWDLTFLTSLYASEALQFATQQRVSISRQFQRDLEKSQTESR